MMQISDTPPLLSTRLTNRIKENNDTFEKVLVVKYNYHEIK